MKLRVKVYDDRFEASGIAYEVADWFHEWGAMLYSVRGVGSK